MTSKLDLVIGVDGGGTKTVAWLAPTAGRRDELPFGVGEAGPGNPRAVGFDTAQHNIALAVRRAWDNAGLTPAVAAAACLGLAGAGRPEEQQAIEVWARKHEVARHVQVTHDAEIILAAGTRRADGIALICGTGSFAWGKNSTGACERSGGWGYLFGDEGSGYAMALAGLRAVASATDGRGPATVLQERMLAAVEVTQASDLIGRLYRPTVSRDWIASLASVVCDAAADDDVATEILQTAAHELAMLVVSLVARLQFRQEGYSLVLAGGVIANQMQLRDQLLNLLKATQIRPAESIVVANPVCGATELARRLLTYTARGQC
ncbi:MAG: N-acetylglucosamine kinase [Planctomycetaceae bacterium]